MGWQAARTTGWILRWAASFTVLPPLRAIMIQQHFTPSLHGCQWHHRGQGNGVSPSKQRHSRQSDLQQCNSTAFRGVAPDYSGEGEKQIKGVITSTEATGSLPEWGTGKNMLQIRFFPPQKLPHFIWQFPFPDKFSIFWNLWFSLFVLHASCNAAIRWFYIIYIPAQIVLLCLLLWLQSQSPC